MKQIQKSGGDFSWRTRSLLARASAAALLAFSSQAAAQSVLTAPPPTHYSVDPRGIDVLTGKFTLTTVDASVGDPEAGGLAYARTYFGGGWRDSVTGTVNPYSGGVTVSIGGQSEEFSQIGSTFTALAGTGSTLTKTSNLYTYKSASGLTAVFSMEFSGYTGQAAGYGIISLTRPSGDTLTYKYTTVTVPKTPGGIPMVTTSRLQSVVSNSGYQIGLSYLEDDPPTTAYLNQFLRLTGVTASNRATATTHAWPYATYAGSAVNRSGITTNYAFGANGPTAIRRPTSTIDDIVITYDSAGRVATWSDNGDTWTYGYVVSGSSLTLTVTNPLGKVETYVSYTPTKRLISYKDALNNTMSYQYDTYGRLTRATAPEGNYTQYAYDTRGNVTSTTHVPKAGSGLATIVTSAVYPTTCANPATCNQPTSTTDARGAVTDYTYASHGGVLTVTEPAPTSGAVRPQARYAYDSLYAWYRNDLGVMAQAPTHVVRPTQVSQCATTASCVGTADEVKTTIGYGAAGVPSNRERVQLTQGSGDGALTATTTVAYTPDGDIKSVDGPLPGADDTTTYRYDAVRRPVGIIGPDPDGAGPLKRRAVRNSFNQDGQVILSEQGTVDGLSDTNWAAFASLQQVGTTYDTWGRPIAREATGGGVVHALQQVSYDAAGRTDCTTIRMNPAAFASPPASACTAATAGAFGPDRISKNGYDATGRLTSTISGLGMDPITESVTFSANGKPLTLTDGEGNVSTIEYDGFDRPVKMRYPNSASSGSSTTDYEQYAYDAASQVLTYRNRGGNTFTSGYDALGRQTSLTGSGMAARSFTYDHLGRVTGAAINAGASLTRTWDAHGRMTSETQNPLGKTVAYQYDLAGRRTRLTWPDGFFVNYDYNVAGDLTAIRENGVTDWQLTSWAYDNLGRRTAQGRANGAYTYWTYDAAGRLGQLTHDLPGTAQDQALNFTYNPAGQILSRTMSNTAYAHTPGVGTTTYVNNGKNQVTNVGGSAVGYDARQNTAAAPMGTYGYDGLNQLTSANVGSGALSLSYDPAGRLFQSAGGATYRFLYDAAQMVGEYDASGNLQRRFIPGLGMDEHALTYEGAGVADRRWMMQDERRSVVAYTSGSGATLSINTYDEFGQPGPGNAGRFQYTGQMWLPEAQLYHYKARVYAPQLGRFMQTDPIGYGAGANLYGYVGADPMNATDPSGLAAQVSQSVCWWPEAGNIACSDIFVTGGGSGRFDRFVWDSWLGYGGSRSGGSRVPVCPAPTAVHISGTVAGAAAGFASGSFRGQLEDVATGRTYRVKADFGGGVGVNFGIQSVNGTLNGGFDVLGSSFQIWYAYGGWGLLSLGVADLKTVQGLSGYQSAGKVEVGGLLSAPAGTGILEFGTVQLELIKEGSCEAVAK